MSTTDQTQTTEKLVEIKDSSLVAWFIGFSIICFFFAAFGLVFMFQNGLQGAIIFASGFLSGFGFIATAKIIGSLHEISHRLRAIQESRG